MDEKKKYINIQIKHERMLLTDKRQKDYGIHHQSIFMSNQSSNDFEKAFVFESYYEHINKKYETLIIISSKRTIFVLKFDQKTINLKNQICCEILNS